MFTRILVPLDGSRFARTALPLAATLARNTGAALEICSSHDLILPPTSPGAELAGTQGIETGDPGLMGDLRETARQGREEDMARTAERLRAEAGVEAAVTLVEGEPSEAVRARVEETGADLVVMSTHGRGSLERAWLGSVADRLVRHLHIPVLLVRPIESDEEVDLATPPLVARVVVALDGSSLAEAVLEPATRLAAALQAPVHLIRVVDPHLGPSSSYIPHAAAELRERTREEREEATSYLATVSGRLADGGVQVAGQSVHEGPVARTLLDSIDPDGADLLAMATHGRGGLRRLVLGSVSDKVLRGALGPVLLVRPEREGE